MLSVLHPKNHTVPVYRRTFRIARLEVHLDLWVAEQLVWWRAGSASSAGQAGSSSSARDARDALQCEVHANTAVTEIGSETAAAVAVPSTSSSSSNSGVRRVSPTAADSVVTVLQNRDVIVEPRPAAESDADSAPTAVAAEDRAQDAVAAAEITTEVTAELQTEAEESETAEKALDEAELQGVPDEQPVEEERADSAPRKSLETAV